MKLAFTTLACPAWSIAQVADTAARLGYDAVELRLLDGRVIDPVADRAAAILAVAQCRERGVEVCAFDTSCRFNLPDPAERARQLGDLREWIELAHATGVPLLRVFGGMGVSPGPADDRAIEWVAAALGDVALRAEGAHVTVMLETHDAFASAASVAAVLQAVPSPAIAALWDSHHPYRMGESPQQVLDLLGPRLVHVHVKDARRTGPGLEDWQLVPMGEGEVPVRPILTLLDRHGYTGYISVEWEKKWHPELADPETALPQHIAWLRAALGR